MAYYFCAILLQCTIVYFIRTRVFVLDRMLLILSVIVISLGWAKLAVNFFAADGVVNRERKSFMWVYFFMYPFWSALLNMVQVCISIPLHTLSCSILPTAVPCGDCSLSLPPFYFTARNKWC